MYYPGEWRDETKIPWVKAHMEDGGAKTTDHEQQKKSADDDAGKSLCTPGLLPVQDMIMFTIRRDMGGRD